MRRGHAPKRTPRGEKGTAPLWRPLGAASKWRPEKLFYRINFANGKKIRDENLISTYHCDLKNLDYRAETSYEDFSADFLTILP